jgi:hypothetical protein
MAFAACIDEWNFSPEKNPGKEALDSDVGRRERL